jgi:hypothetical protein
MARLVSHPVDMLKAKDGDFLVFDWLRNRDTVELLGIWESICNPDFNYGEFAAIKSRAGFNPNNNLSILRALVPSKSAGVAWELHL